VDCRHSCGQPDDLLRRGLELCRRSAGFRIHRLAQPIGRTYRLAEVRGIQSIFPRFPTLHFLGIEYGVHVLSIPLDGIGYITAIDGLRQEWHEGCREPGSPPVSSTAICCSSNPFTIHIRHDDPAIWKQLWRVCNAQALTGGSIGLVTIMIEPSCRGDVLGDRRGWVCTCPGDGVVMAVAITGYTLLQRNLRGGCDEARRQSLVMVWMALGILYFFLPLSQHLFSHCARKKAF